MDSTTTQTAAAAGFLGASIMLILLVGLVFLVLTIIARWKVFTKAGEEGWKSIIPVYSSYVEWKIGWTNINLFWVYLGLIVGGMFLGFISGQFTTNAYGETVAAPGFGFLGIFCTLMLFAGGIISLVAKFKLFQSFGKGVGFFVAYIFFNNIMLLVLGFGSAQYKGAQD